MNKEQRGEVPFISYPPSSILLLPPNIHTPLIFLHTCPWIIAGNAKACWEHILHFLLLKQLKMQNALEQSHCGSSLLPWFNSWRSEPGKWTGLLHSNPQVCIDLPNILQCSFLFQVQEPGRGRSQALYVKQETWNTLWARYVRYGARSQCCTFHALFKEPRGQRKGQSKRPALSMVAEWGRGVKLLLTLIFKVR